MGETGPVGSPGDRVRPLRNNKTKINYYMVCSTVLQFKPIFLTTCTFDWLSGFIQCYPFVHLAD